MARKQNSYFVVPIETCFNVGLRETCKSKSAVKNSLNVYFYNALRSLSKRADLLPKTRSHLSFEKYL